MAWCYFGLRCHTVIFISILFAATIFTLIGLYLQLSLYSILKSSINSMEGASPRDTYSSAKLLQDSYLPWKDDNSLLDIIDFQFITNNVSLCHPIEGNSKDNDNILPILVHSGRFHFDERNGIRKTYGSVKKYKSWSIRLIFLLGESSKEKINTKNEQRLSEEISSYGDVVIGSFVDIYGNLPYKHLMGYKWILNFCHWAGYVLKVDDDMFIDIFRIIDANLQVPFENKEWICNIFSNTTPQRDPRSKYFVSKEKFSDSIYPTYCSGWCYGISVEWIYKIYSISQRVPCCIIDDVFVTGVLRAYAEKVYNETAALQFEFWEEVTSDTKSYEKLCLKINMNEERHFGAVVYIPRGEYFINDITCLWNKTLESQAL